MLKKEAIATLARVRANDVTRKNHSSFVNGAYSLVFQKCTTGNGTAVNGVFAVLSVKEALLAWSGPALAEGMAMPEN